MTAGAPRAYAAGLPAALAATALWGFTFLGPAAVEPVNAYYLVVGRYAVFGLMSLAVLAARRGGLRTLGRRRLLTAVHLGVVGYIGFYLLLSLSSAAGGGVLASTLTGLIPLLVTLVSNALEKVLAWRRLLVPVAVICGGLLLLNGSPAPGADRSGSDLATGSALGFLAAVAWSYFVIVNRRVLERAGPSVDSTAWTACIGLGACAGSLLLLPAAWAVGGSPFSGGRLTSFLLWCLALAVLGSWCATWFWNAASKRLPSTVMGPVIGMEAVFGAVFNLLWEGRAPTARESWGGLLVVGGVLLASSLFHRAGAASGPPRAEGRTVQRPGARRT